MTNERAPDEPLDFPHSTLPADQASNVDNLSDPTFARVAEASMRMFAGVVPGPRRSEVAKLAREAGDGGYPWQAIADRVVADPMRPDELVQRSLVAQRNWVAQNSKPSVGKQLARANKTVLAWIIGRSIATLIWFVMFVLVALLVKIRFPAADLYHVLDLVPEDVMLRLRALLGAG